MKFISLISGSSGNATLISDGGTNILVDCGMSGKKLSESLAAIDMHADELDALLITHEHIDHVRGAGVIARRYNIPVYATEGTFASMETGAIPEWNVISPDADFEIGSIGVMPFSIPHDASQPVGYSFFSDDRKYTIATDIGHMSGYVLNHLTGSDTILLESNHDIDMLRMGTYPFPLKQRILSSTGHLSNDDAAEALCRLAQSGTEHFMLGHLSKENNTPQIAYMSAQNALSEAGINVGGDITLTVAQRNAVTLCEAFV